MDITTHRQQPLPHAGKLRLSNDDGQARVVDSNGRRMRVRPEAGTPVHYVAGVLQVETATVTAAAGATSDGDLTLTITSAALAGSPLEVLVPVTTADDSANKVATAIRAVLNATEAITNAFTVGGTNAAVSLTRIGIPEANDATLNIAIAAARGVSAVASSANTTAGVARVNATEGCAGDQLFDSTNLYIALADVTKTSTSGWVKIAHASL